MTTTDASPGPARPIRLVYCDERRKFQMDPEAVSVLKLIKEPIGVALLWYAIPMDVTSMNNDMAMLLFAFTVDQLLGRSSGFQVASTHRPCTKGLWLWSTPLRRTALDGTGYNLLLIDSEGIDAYDQTGTYSTQIFPLAVLLSSMVIYNQMGGIDEAAIDRLSLVTKMTKHIRVRASTTPSELGQFSPIFVWLLRGNMVINQDVAEFISAIAVGNNAQLMVVLTAATAKSTTLGLVVAAEQTGGHAISIFKGTEFLHSSKQALGARV
ncbi:guanylate-binding family protein [Artemisia annua]|uniref:Guanylate-binding family protein n=1 Tax=Artemisia annua TaxID=35608 RepID=A0A2U1NUW3_ARTAN|nr:guanylate-binding family protein [Artemisia annua]